MATKKTFQTEVTQLLDLMINSLYSNKEIFLRELVSNASDALDKLHYLNLSDEQYKKLEFTPRIDIEFDEKKGTITIKDNGIGMNEQEMNDNLGVIAKSGTKSFLSQLSGDKKKDSNLIGQFGVGFYSAYMVASRVIVSSKKPNSDKAYAWVSDGKGEYEIGECIKEDFGTEIVMYLKEEDKHFASKWEIQNIINKYSQHIAYPVYLHYKESVKQDPKDEKSKDILESKVEQINSAKALWTISKTELKKEDYEEFYKSFSHDNNPPLAYLHTKVEGTQEYTTLFYIPKVAPFDMFRVDYKSGVKLYVKKVFITDDDKELLPSYLRFIKGVIDSADLPLNVSREILQQNKILSNIKSASVKKILSEIEKLSKKEEVYKEFYAQYGKVLKEGLYSDYENKDKILELLRFSVADKDGIKENISLKSYKDSMPKDQKSIYYALGENKDLLSSSPNVEKYVSKGYSVLILSEEVDGFVMPSITEYDKIALKNINEASDELGENKIEESVLKEYEDLIGKFKSTLGEKVKDVKLSSAISSAPVCLIKEDANPMMANLFAQMGQKMPESKPTLELNYNSEMIQALKDSKNIDKIIDMLFSSALLSEGESLKDAKTFNQNLYALLLDSIKTKA